MAVETINIPSEVAQDLFDSGDGEILGGFRYVTDQDEGSGRWQAHHLMVLEHLGTGNFYAIAYSMGLTENQDHDFPWKSDWKAPPVMVTAFRVYPKLVCTTEYKRAED